MKRLRICIVSSGVPFPPVGGGLLRTYYLAHALSMRHEVTLAGYTFNEEHEQPPFPVRVVAVPWEEPPLYRRMRDCDPAVSDAATKTLEDVIDEPWFVSFYESSAMEDSLKHLMQEGIDLVLFEGTDMTRFLPLVPKGVPKIMDLMDVHSLMAERTAAKMGSLKDRGAKEAERTLAFERRSAHQCDLCLVCSEAEGEVARSLLGVSRIDVIPNCVDTSFFTPTDEKPTSGYILFTGTMNYIPNIEAVKFFSKEIFPAIQKEMPDAVFHIVGNRPAQEVVNLASENIVVHGRVPDMRPYYRQAAVVVVPILSGGGTRLKILEAAACGKAIVATKLGVEGLRFEPMTNIEVVDRSSGFADAVLHFLRNEVRREQFGKRARDAALAYDWRAVGERFLHIVEKVGGLQ